MSGPETDVVEPTDAETLTALRGSIAKWEAIANGTGLDLGSSNCPLCQLFFDNPDCRGCPVAAATGEWGCGRTPYEDEWAKIVGWKAKPPYSAEALVAAQHEVDFLKSLLPKEAR